MNEDSKKEMNRKDILRKKMPLTGNRSKIEAYMEQQNKMKKMSRNLKTLNHFAFATKLMN